MTLAISIISSVGMLYSSAFNSLVCINAKLHVLNLYTEFVSYIDVHSILAFYFRYSNPESNTIFIFFQCRTKASGAGVEEQIFQSHTHPIR